MPATIILQCAMSVPWKFLSGRFLAQFWKDFHRRMGAVGLEPTETEVEGFTVIKKLLTTINLNT